jgi:hypothetical protein
MKTRWILRGVALLGILGCAGCKDGNSLTDPDGLDLNGAWTGTMTHYGSPTCAREDVSVALTQQGGAVSGSFRTSCEGMLDIRAELNGDSVSGTLNRADGSSIGQMSEVLPGRAFASRPGDLKSELTAGRACGQCSTRSTSLADCYPIGARVSF